MDAMTAIALLPVVDGCGGTELYSLVFSKYLNDYTYIR